LSNQTATVYHDLGGLSRKAGHHIGAAVGAKPVEYGTFPRAKEQTLKTAMWLCAWAVVLAACPFGATGQDKEDKFDAAKLVGTWNYVSAVKDGKKMEAADLKGQTVTITKETFTLKSKDTFVMKYVVDAKKKPIGIKFEITESPFGPGAKAEGIIELKGDELKICYAPLEGAAPKTFESKEGSRYHLFVLKRAK
jgi:uncharacterized protein (TIGR03067 family)